MKELKKFNEILCKCGEILIDRVEEILIDDTQQTKSYCKCGEVRSIKFIIPIEKFNNKWWQIWKKSPTRQAKESLANLMSIYKEDIKMPEADTSKVYFSNPEVNEAYIRDMEDPEVYTPGKPLELNEDGKIKFYKSYWFVTDNNLPAPNIESLSFNESTGEIDLFKIKLEGKSKIDNISKQKDI